MKKPSALDVIVEIEKMGGLQHFTGSADFDSLLPFLQGVAFGLKAAGVYDLRYQHFLEWLRKSGQSPPEGGWQAFFVASSPGDNDEAVRRFTKAAAAFVQQEPAD